MKGEAPTVVVFRVYKDGQVIALFPEIVASTVARYAVQSYLHIGQHGAADHQHVISMTKPATPEQYAPLKSELESAPYEYVLCVKRRVNYRDCHWSKRHAA